MARPQKFRHSREALNDQEIAAKLGGFVLDIETLRAKRKQIDDQIAAAYDAVDDAGFEKKFVRKTIALRAKEEGARADDEQGLEAYEFAVEKGVSLVRTRRDRSASQSYAEAKSVGPKLVETVVKGVQTEIGRKALVAALDVMIEREEAETGDTQEQPETAIQSEAPTSRPEAVANSAAHIDTPATAKSPAQEPTENEGSGGRQDSRTIHTATNSHSSEPNPSPATADKTGEAVTSPAVSPVDLSDDDVPAFLKKDSGPVDVTSPEFILRLRPFCQSPNNCGGYGRECPKCKARTA